MDKAVLIPHLFRTEYRKIIAVLCSYFGFDQIELAEDITSDTFLTATQVWGLNGVPQNPVAWLYHVAKNKAINHVRRTRHFETHISPDLEKEAEGNKMTDPYEQEIDLSPENIKDSQLQMMFAICHPSITPEAQIGLSLRILCGFGIEEIADAFLTNKETINKRLYRAREKLREEKVSLSFPEPAEIEERLTSVLATIYLLFNEGYYSLSGNSTLRKELCLEAMRLCIMLTENRCTDQPQANALLALMCFHASRFEARLDSKGTPVLYEDQDTGLWDQDLIAKGGVYLHAAGRGNNLSKYHLEAGIAYWNTRKEDTLEKWENILQFYNHFCCK
ncbi:RNA polymerase sigma factor [Flavitalea flava]